MKSDLISIYNSNDSTKVYLLQQVLISNNIDARVVDKPSSAYPWMAEYELYVPKNEVIKSIQLIKETEKND
jgi:hypothetical protein